MSREVSCLPAALCCCPRVRPGCPCTPFSLWETLLCTAMMLTTNQLEILQTSLLKYVVTRGLSQYGMVWLYQDGLAHPRHNLFPLPPDWNLSYTATNKTDKAGLHGAGSSVGVRVKWVKVFLKGVEHGDVNQTFDLLMDFKTNIQVQFNWISFLSPV